MLQWRYETLDCFLLTEKIKAHSLPFRFPPDVVLAAIYAAFFVVSIVYWMFDDMRHSRGFFAKKAELSTGAPQKMKFGGNSYGALSTKN